MTSPFSSFASRFAPGKKSGFTLIELLVVISIIAILSSIVLAALSGARSGAKYAAVQESLFQMRDTYELQYASSTSYSVIMPSGIPNALSGTYSSSCFVYPTSGTLGSNYCTITSVGACDAFYTANSQADAICKNILSSSNLFVFGVINTSSANPDINDYAFAVQNPGNTSSYFCIRSSGNSLAINTTGFNTCLNTSNW